MNNSSDRTDMFMKNINTRYKYHFEPQKGWMNDPNGLVFFKGCYHAFFQHNPYAAHWDKMHWGHAVSTDLLTWKELDIALFPDMPYENEGGCYSGSAIVKDDILYLFYTSVSHELGQTQSLAISEDGIHFTKYEGNPVINHWPLQGSKEFRDPMVFANPKGGYSMVIGSDHDGHGRVLMYNSSDLFHWNYSHVLYEATDYNSTIECPNFFPLEDKYVLMYSCMDFHTYSVRFVIGEFDGVNFVPERICTPEAGPQFYAPQTFETPDKRRIMIGWFFDWKREVAPNAVSAGALTVPREITLADGDIRTYPVREAASLLSSYPHTDLSKEDNKLIIHNTSVGDLVCPLEIEHIEILEDTKGYELFVNNGLWSASIVK